MRAIILAAGVGDRLRHAAPRPKCLLEFGDRTLLARHLDNLAALGVENATLCVGFESERIRAAVAGRCRPRLLLCHNPLYRLGSIVSLWTARHALTCGDDVLIMDADVLYHPAILARLVSSPHPSCFLVDRHFATGEEPVKICLRDGRIVEFRKQLEPGLTYNLIGESVGFFKFEPDAALRLASLAGRYVADERREWPHEEALRDLALADDAGVGVEDVTGLPWIEIDFPEDIERARNEILPAIDRP